MIREILVWLFVLAAIGVMIGGASLIVMNNSAMPGADVPSGFLHWNQERGGRVDQSLVLMTDSPP